jgi:hypothetical protein
MPNYPSTLPSSTTSSVVEFHDDEDFWKAVEVVSGPLDNSKRLICVARSTLILLMPKLNQTPRQ